MIRRMLPFIKKYRWYTLLCPLMIVGEVLLEVNIPILMANIVDIGIPSGDIGYVARTGGLMVVMALLSLLFGALAARFSAKAGMGFGSELRGALFRKTQDFSFANTDKFSTASLITRLTTDVNNLQNAFMMVIRMFVRAPVMLVSATFMAFRLNSSLALVFFIAIPVLGIGLGLIASVIYPRFSIMLKKYDAMNRSVQENLIAIRVVKAFVRSRHEKDKFKTANDDLMNASIHAEKIMILNGPLMQITMYSCIMAILWFGGNMIIGGTMQTGQLISFINYVTQILMSLMMITMVFVQAILSRASFTRICEVLDEEIDITDGHADANLEVTDGSVTFQDVSFRYNVENKENVLQHINLTIQPGETVGIIGGTGSSKTSLVQLIPRLYDATEGAVLVGGHDVRDYTLTALRSQVSMVLQNNVLFSGTIEENLRWGNENATHEQIVDACKAAQAHDFISSFPDGYNTWLGQGGVNVSGGQKQRLCIARALLKAPKIIILDDSTSAVDTATDANIRQAFRENLKGTTTIIIAQRISSVMDADKIIVMDDGKIDGIGTHEQLMETNEIYREVNNSQQKGVA